MGPANDGRRYLLNVQPVIPISLNAEWNLISRTIVQLIDQQDVVPGEGSQSGAGNIVQSLFLSPALPTASGVIWGAGPAFLLPTASVSLLGSEKWGIGPTGVALRQQGAWTVGALATPLHAAAGDDDAAAGSWQFEATPYLWAAGLDGTLAINNRPQQDLTVQQDFSGLFKILDLAASGSFEARNGRWGVLFDAVYFKVSRRLWRRLRPELAGDRRRQLCVLAGHRRQARLSGRRLRLQRAEFRLRHALRRPLPRTGIPLVRTICRSTLCLTLSGASARLHKP
jgi:hypothetical protein